jgi:hypothetical protein
MFYQENFVSLEAVFRIPISICKKKIWESLHRYLIVPVKWNRCVRYLITIGCLNHSLMRIIAILISEWSWYVWRSLLHDIETRIWTLFEIHDTWNSRFLVSAWDRNWCFLIKTARVKKTRKSKGFHFAHVCHVVLKTWWAFCFWMLKSDSDHGRY